ncbi:hypothetical protein [Candidatus Azobacteroides pseudotrichonymphae]|nr:hypothetical protein [Candidatus Azobacteroides pseudotrichonymphae]
MRITNRLGELFRNLQKETIEYEDGKGKLGASIYFFSQGQK